tara:strand:- start:292 stop:720 length:429 start_codon:yes stop_codon:yes gene_type:complete
MIEQFYTHAKHTFTDLEKIQIYLAQVQGMILGIITHLGNKETLDNFVGDDDIKSNITIAHLTTITYSSESDTIYIYFNDCKTGELVKDALEILFLETNEVCKSITTDEVGATFIIELNYGEKEIIKYSMRNKLGSIELKNYV